MSSISVNPPPIGSVWLHRNGNTYRVQALANLPNEERYPLTVVYQNVHNGSIWARRADDWSRSFELVTL